VPFFLVHCKNPNKDCPTILQTPYFTDYHTEAEIKRQMEGCESVRVMCSECYFTATYTYQEFLILDTK
jgi:hypothetical protein